MSEPARRAVADPSHPASENPPATETMMPLLLTIRRSTLVIAFITSLLMTHTAHAAAHGATLNLPVLWGKDSWLIGYALLFLAILLGMLALLIPSLRKPLRKKDY
jgi:hypothetical protein